MAPRTKETPETSSEITVQDTPPPTPHTPGHIHSHTEAKSSHCHPTVDNPSTERAPLPATTTRTSPRNTNEGINDDLIKKAKKASADLRNKGSLQQKAKDDIATIIDELIEKAKQQPTKATAETATQNNEPTITVSEKDFQATDKKLDLIINILTKEPPKRWAQIAAAQPTIKPAAKQHPNKERKDRPQFEITLSAFNAPETTQELISSTSHKDITTRLQKTIDKATLLEKPQLKGVTKLGRDMIRLQTETKEGAKAIKEADIAWSDAFPGMQVYKPKYGVVIHGVPTDAISFDRTDLTEIKDDLQSQNTSNEINITHITPLRKARKRHKPTAHQSIVLFTEEAEAADRCIEHGFLIEKQILKTEKYAPHLHITQCYKCHRYGHRAAKCRQKEQCGKCADEHSTTDCTSEKLKCINCKGNYEAWHIECPARSQEGARLTQLRMDTSPFFTK